VVIVFPVDNKVPHFSNAAVVGQTFDLCIFAAVGLTIIRN
jgi:hypothetical protein